MLFGILISTIRFDKEIFRIELKIVDVLSEILKDFLKDEQEKGTSFACFYYHILKAKYLMQKSNIYRLKQYLKERKKTERFQLKHLAILSNID